MKVLKTKQKFIKTFASTEPTLQNLEVVEVKIANVENLNYEIINALVVPLICTLLSEQCVSIAKNQYVHLKYLNLTDSSDTKIQLKCIHSHWCRLLLGLCIQQYKTWKFWSSRCRNHIRLGP